MNEEKKFITPIAEIIEFYNDEIITESDGALGCIGDVDDTEVM